MIIAQIHRIAGLYWSIILMILVLTGCEASVDSARVTPQPITYLGQQELTFEGLVPIPPNVTDIQQGSVRILSIKFFAPATHYPLPSDILTFYEDLLIPQGWQQCVKDCYAVKYRRTDITERRVYEYGRAPRRQFLDVVIIPKYFDTPNAGYIVFVRRDNCDSTSCVRPNDQETGEQL